jgi:hypothetical protein
MARQPVRLAKVTRMMARETTDFVTCDACGRKGGWMTRFEFTVYATQGGKTFPVEANVHTDCILGTIPMALIESITKESMTVKRR